ncbi:hypothetical protein [Fusobacterium polymorphum]|uniref:hypothetical protein n=1 Tax=Fusobacterium nucleatum subsp. polymorphum TaxID=76857 RepID=UPI0030D5B6E4
MEELSRQFKAGEIDEKQLKEAVRELAKGYGKDIGIEYEVVYLDEETMPEDAKGSTGSSYILDKKNKKVLIPIDVSKIGDINELLGTLTEEVSHGKDALEGRQDKKVAEDKSNDEEGLESLGRPANDYVKNKLGEDNNSKIKLSTDGIDLTNAAVGGIAATTVGWAKVKYGGDQIKNGLFDEKIVQPKHIIADSPLFRNNKELYYLAESMIGIGAIQAAPHTFPIGTVENIPLQQGALPYYSNTYTNLPAVTNVGNTSLALYNNQNGLFAPVGTNVIPAMTPLLITDGANKVNQVQNNSLPYNSKLALPVKYPIVTKSGVTLYKGYAMGPRGAKYTEVGVSNNKEIVYKNSNGSYFKLTDNGLENISSKDVIKKEYFPTVKVQKNNGSNPSAGKDYYVSKEGNFKVKKYIEAGQTIEDYDKTYLAENARARGINVGR